MFSFEEKYYRITKQSLQIFGLWIDQNFYQRFVGLLVWYIPSWTMILPLVAMVFHEYKKMNIFIENTLMISFFLGLCVKFHSAFTSSKQMEALYLKISLDWQKIISHSERSILQRHCHKGLELAKWYRICMVCSSRPFIPLVMNKISPLENGTRPPAMPYYSDYIFFEQADYLYWVCAYLFATHTFIMLPFISGIDSFYIMTVSHTCGLFAVICYRIETASSVQNVNGQSHIMHRNFEIRKKLKQAVKLHIETIRSVQLIEDLFSNFFIAVNVLSIGGLGLAGAYTTLVLDDGYQLFRCIAMGVGIVIHLLMINWVGQQIIDSSEQIFYSAYSSEWYLMSPKTRKYILLIMMVSNYPCALTAGKVMNMSMEIFGMIMRHSASYITVFLSIT